MVGFYADPPGQQIMYDVDGSVGFDAAATTLSLLNNTDPDSTPNVPTFNAQSCGVIFAELKDIVGYFIATIGGSSHSMDTSVDTTNGVDGTWVARGAYVFSSEVKPAFRSAITAVVWNGIRSIRWKKTTISNTANGYQAAHFYGAPSLAGDRLRIWHPTLNQPLSGSGLDFGDLRRGSTLQKDFRVKNDSATLTANNIVVSFTEPATIPNPTMSSQMSLSQGGGFSNTQSIGNLAPGAISSICTLKISALLTAALSLWRQRVKAVATNWS